MVQGLTLNRENRIRLIAFDGGGIYGYCTAIMLRRLCTEMPHFLGRGCVKIFAGTSIGALISLLLAKEEEPRRLIMSGELEALFFNENLYANKINPITRVLSLYGLTAWSGGAEMDRIMNEHFGNMRMGDLKHRVLISTFAMGAKEGPNTWHTHIWRNFPEDRLSEQDENMLVRDVAYGAVSPSTLRPIRNYLTDGGMTAMSPAISALAEIIDKPPKLKSMEEKAQALRNRTHSLVKGFYHGTVTLAQIVAELPDLLHGWDGLLEAGDDYGYGYDKTDYEQILADLKRRFKDLRTQAEATGSLSVEADETLHLIMQVAEITRYRYDRLDLLRKIELLSVGVGSRVPGYHIGNYDYGLVPFGLLPTNLWQSFFSPPLMQLMYDPNSKYISQTAGRLLGDPDRFFRLDPEVIGYPVPPVIPATYLARFPYLRWIYLHTIEEQARLIPAEVYDNAIAWIQSRGWDQPMPQPAPAAPSPSPEAVHV